MEKTKVSDVDGVVGFQVGKRNGSIMDFRSVNEENVLRVEPRTSYSLQSANEFEPIDKAPSGELIEVPYAAFTAQDVNIEISKRDSTLLYRSNHRSSVGK